MPFKPLARLALSVAVVILCVNVTDGFQLRNTPLMLPADQQFTNAGRQVVASSPDGKHFIYVANQRIYLKSIDKPQPAVIAGTENLGVTNPFFSPDSKTIAFWAGSDQTFKRIPVEGGAAVTITRGGNPFGASWGPGDQIVYGARAPEGSGVARVSSKGGSPEIVVSTQANEVAHGPQILPGGDAILFTLATIPTGNVSAAELWDKARIVVYSISSNQRKTVIEGGSDARYLPSGHLVYAVGTTIYAARFDLQRLEIAGKPVVALEDVRRAGGTGTAQFSSSSTGSLIYLSANAEFRLATVDMNGNEKTIGRVPSSIFGPRLSPDGKQLAFDAVDPQTSVPVLWVYDLPTNRLRKIGLPGMNRFAYWSPDGKRILYISEPGAQSSLNWVSADGTGRPEVLLDTARAPEFWSAPNQFLSFITLKINTNTADYDIWTYSFETRKATPLIEIAGSAQHSSRFSPDGRWVAYISDESGRHEVYVQPYPLTGDKFQITRNGGGHPLWSPDGKQLFYDNAGRLFSVDIQMQPRFTAGEPKPMPISGFVQPAGNNRRQYDITEDGKQFLMIFPLPNEIQIVNNWLDVLNRIN